MEIWQCPHCGLGCRVNHHHHHHPRQPSSSAWRQRCQQTEKAQNPLQPWRKSCTDSSRELSAFGGRQRNPTLNHRQERKRSPLPPQNPLQTLTHSPPLSQLSPIRKPPTLRCPPLPPWSHPAQWRNVPPPREQPHRAPLKQGHPHAEGLRPPQKPHRGTQRSPKRFPRNQTFLNASPLKTKTKTKPKALPHRPTHGQPP